MYGNDQLPWLATPNNGSQVQVGKTASNSKTLFSQASQSPPNQRAKRSNYRNLNLTLMVIKKFSILMIKKDKTRLKLLL
jgi:hypothetical protein